MRRLCSIARPKIVSKKLSAMTFQPSSVSPHKRPTFIDVFAGAGGLSLGLLQAGWNGLFAVEKSDMAFETLKHNLVNQETGPRFDWPTWLPAEPIGIEEFLQTYKSKVQEHLQDIDLLAGGPPCQGFSTAGRRKRDDERNLLFEKYLEFVALVKPKMILLENVRGFATSFTKSEKGGKEIEIEEDIFNADQELQKRLTKMGFVPFSQYSVMAKDFGVPQLRPRYILIAIRKDLLDAVPELIINPFKILYGLRKAFLARYDLPFEKDVTLKEAISDLELRHGYKLLQESQKRAFRYGNYGDAASTYQRVMRKDRNGNPITKGVLADSHRFPNHAQDIQERFQRIIREFRPGIQLSDEERKQLNVNKHRIAPLAANEPCHTLTSLPDDLIHYKEPRIPTVREYARIQSFPDWFEFKSKYTTGGDRRRVEVPRYTQAANAVPPMLAEALGLTLCKVHELLCQRRASSNVQPEGRTSDISDVDWLIIEPLLRRKDMRGPQTHVNLRDIWIALQFRLQTQCRWNDLPPDFPKAGNVQNYYQKWKGPQLQLALATLSDCSPEKAPDVAPDVVGQYEQQALPEVIVATAVATNAESVVEQQAGLIGELDLIVRSGLKLVNISLSPV